MSDQKNENVSFLEFTLPLEFDGGELQYIDIGFNVTEKFKDKYYGYEGEEYPPANEDVCMDLARDFEKNYNTYFEEGMIRYANMFDSEIESKMDLKNALDQGRLKFIY